MFNNSRLLGAGTGDVLRSLLHSLQTNIRHPGLPSSGVPHRMSPHYRIRHIPRPQVLRGVVRRIRHLLLVVVGCTHHVFHKRLHSLHGALRIQGDRKMADTLHRFHVLVDRKMVDSLRDDSPTQFPVDDVRTLRIPRPCPCCKNLPSCHKKTHHDVHDRTTRDHNLRFWGLSSVKLKFRL